MYQIIEWCNENTGFFSAVLSLMTLVTSIIAIVISIYSARLPYKKGVILSSYNNFHYYEDENTKHVKSDYVGMSISIANIGNRDINIIFLGLCYKNGKWNKCVKEIFNIKNDVGGKGIVKPTEVKEANYDVISLIAALENINPETYVYLYAKDSEGKMYFKRINKAKNILNDISKYIRK